MTRRRVTVEGAPGMGALAEAPATDKDVLLDKLNADASKVYDTGERIFAAIKEEMERRHWGSYFIINVDNGQHIFAPSLGPKIVCYGFRSSKGLVHENRSTDSCSMKSCSPDWSLR